MQSANLGLLIKPRKFSSRKCKVGENAILGLLRTKNHEKYAFTLNIVLVTCGIVVRCRCMYNLPFWDKSSMPPSNMC